MEQHPQRSFALVSGCGLLALIVGLTSGCTGSADEDTLDGIRRRGELRWGADLQGGEPYVFEDPSRPGHVLGFEAEIADALARELGVRATLVQNDWSTLVPSLERGSFDIALNGLERTESRAQRIGMTRAYYTFEEQLVVRSDETRIRDLSSVRGVRVGTLTNSLAWDMLEPAGAERVAYEGVEEPFADLLNRRTDAVLLDDIIVMRYGDKPGLRVASNVGSGDYVIGVRKRDAKLTAALNQALERLIASGELRAILRRWQLPGDVTPAAASVDGATPARSTVSTVRGLSTRQIVLFAQGALVTLLISSAAMLIAMSAGLGLALLRLPSPLLIRRVLAVAADAYVEVFRGTPVLLQLYVLYYGIAGWVSLDALPAAILGLGLNYAAYEAEIYRAGIQAVPRGEVEAAHALGMSGALTLRRVVLPQAFRVALPGIANDFIALLKDSSLVSVITVIELTKRMTIASVENRGWLLPGALCALMYLVMSYPLSRLARRLERRLGGEA